MAIEILRSENPDGSIRLSMNITPDEYKEKWNNKIKQLSKKVDLKGFRKGKVPVQMVTRTYGNSALAEILDDLISKSIEEYITGNDLDTIFSPLPVENQNFSLDYKDLSREYDFAFDVCPAPSYEINGASGNDVYDYYEVIVDDEMIEKTMNNIQKRFAVQSDVTSGPMEADDVLYISVFPVGCEDLNEENMRGNTVLSPEDIDNVEAKNQFISNSIGDVFDLDFQSFAASNEKDKLQYVKNTFLYFLAEEESNTEWKCRIDKAVRKQEPEITDEWVAESYPNDEVNTVEELKALVKTNLSSSFANESNNFLKRSIMNRILNDTLFDIPGQFVVSLVKQNENNNEALSDEKINALKDQVRKEIIREHLEKTYKPEVTNEELQSALYESIGSMIRQYQITDRDMQSRLVKNFLEDKRFINDVQKTLIESKILDVIMEDVSKNIIAVSADEFDSLLKEEAEKGQALQAADEED
jgi:trigger factor